MKSARSHAQPYTVLGVAPRGFHGTETFYWAEIWVPMTMQPQIEGRSWLDNENTFNAWIAGRMKTGVAVKQAEANLNTIAAQLAHENKVNEGMHLTLSPPGLAGSTIRAPMRAFAGGVMLLASLVLVAACANLASLLTARAADRERDLAIRVSIGAGRGRIVRQLLTDSLSLSIMCGIAGFLFAVGLLKMISQWRAPQGLPFQFDGNPGWRGFFFFFFSASLCGLLFCIGFSYPPGDAAPPPTLYAMTVWV